MGTARGDFNGAPTSSPRLVVCLVVRGHTVSNRHPGSRHYDRLDRKRWAVARRAALARAGHRSELSGLASALEVHHRVALERGGDPYDLDNLMVLTREEHIEHHRAERSDPAREAWRGLVAEIANS